jgi:creatinine amidohydrolase/Fe(II)-dependent formamide hydrolase-like protein
MRPATKVLALLLALPTTLRAQAPAPAQGAPQSAGPPPTVFFEDLTYNEIRDAIRGGYRNIIVPIGGTEDNGPQMVTGKHNYIVTFAAERIALALGNTLVGPVVPYVPEGNWDPPSGHMARPGTMSLPEDQGYTQLLEAIATSFRGAGFRNVIFIGDSGGNQNGQNAVATKLNTAWSADGVRVVTIPDYYAKSSDDAQAWIVQNLKIPEDQIGGHANIIDTSQLMFVNPNMVRFDRLENGSPTNGISGDSRPSTPQIGQIFMQYKISNAVNQIRQVLGITPQNPNLATALPPAPSTMQMAGPAAPWQARQAPADRPAKVHSLFIEELTFMEVRDAIAAGYTNAIVVTGGVEKNAFHMVTGKHGFHGRAGAVRMAEQLGNALIAPVIQFAPEGAATENNPAPISCRDTCFDNIVSAAARSLKASGFKHILLIGDNGGNQGGLRATAEKLNAEWGNTDVKVFALTDFYDMGHTYLEAHLLAMYGWDAQTVGSHAGIQDTSQMMWVRPQSVRWNRLADSEAQRQESGTSGDPTKATPEFGRLGIEFKANAAVAQYRELSAPPRGQGGGRGRGGGAGGRGGGAGPGGAGPSGF